MVNPEPSGEKLTSSDDTQSAWGHVQKEVCRIFSDLAHMLGSPRSYGEIYGLLFISERPLTMEQIITTLNVSKGTASQGLRVLSEIGAVSRVKGNGSRRHEFLAELELKSLLSGFLRERFTPHLENGTTRLRDLKSAVQRLPEECREVADFRLSKLYTWHHRAMETLPFALRLLQED